MAGEGSAPERTAAVDERSVVEQLAASALERVAPEEIPVFAQTAEEYFHDPEGVLAPRRRDEAVGFGLDAALLTPVVLSVATAVVRFVATTVSEAVQESTKPLIVRLVHKIFRRPTAEPARQVRLEPLTEGQVELVRALAAERGRVLGLDPDQAALPRGLPRRRPRRTAVRTWRWDPCPTPPSGRRANPASTCSRTRRRPPPGSR